MTRCDWCNLSCHVQGNRCNLKRGMQDDVRLQEVAVQLSWKAGCNGGSNEGRCCVIATMFLVRMSTCRTNLNRWIKVLKFILNTVWLFCCLVNCSQTYLADCNSVWLQKLDDDRCWLQMHRWDFKAPIAAGLRVNGDAAGPEVRSVWGELQSILRRYLKLLRNKKYLEEYHWKFHVWFFETLWDVLKQVDMSSKKWRRYYHAQGRFHHAFSSLQVRLGGLFGNTSAESIYACPSVSTANSKHSKLQRDELQMTAIYFAVLFFSFSREEEPARWRPCSWWTYHCW